MRLAVTVQHGWQRMCVVHSPAEGSCSDSHAAGGWPCVAAAAAAAVKAGRLTGMAVAKRKARGSSSEIMGEREPAA